MGAHQFVDDFCSLFTRKACNTRREYYLRILTLFTTLRNVPPFPYNDGERHRRQEKDLKEVAELIGSAVHHATGKHVAKGVIDDSIDKADGVLRVYLKNYCLVTHQDKHADDMKNARAEDHKAAELIQQVASELEKQVRKLQHKRAKTIDLQVYQWDSKSMHHKLLLISGKVKIEDDATLNMLIYRYMDYKLHFEKYDRVDLQLLQLNPQIYEYFPLTKQDWDRVIARNMRQDIPCANPTTTIQGFRSSGDHNRDTDMCLVYDRHDVERGTQLISGPNKMHTPNVDYTSAWFIKDCSSAAVVRLNSLDHSLYYWDLGQHLLTRNDELFLYPDEPSYVPLPSPTFPIAQPWYGSGNQGTHSGGTPPPNNGTLAPSAAPPTAHNKTPPPSQPAPAIIKKPGIAPPRPGQPSSLPAQTPRTNAVPPPASQAPGQGPANVASPPAPPKADVDPHPRRKAPPANDKGSKQRNAGPDAWRMRPSTPVSPNGLVEDDNKRGGWFGSMIKSGLQKLGAYGSSSKS